MAHKNYDTQRVIWE